VTGLAPHRYLLQVRVAHVKALLRDSDRDLALIAMDAGFFDQSHMTRVFRRLTGVTPGVFRAADRAK
jgi:AraC family transcriptional regulator